MTKVECKYCGCHNDVEKERCIGCGSSVPGNEGIVDTFRISGFKYQEAYSGASCMTYLPSSSHFIEYGEPSRPIDAIKSVGQKYIDGYRKGVTE